LRRREIVTGRPTAGGDAGCANLWRGFPQPCAIGALLQRFHPTVTPPLETGRIPVSSNGVVCSCFRRLRGCRDEAIATICDLSCACRYCRAGFLTINILFL
jgi:hypothetical protein